MQPYRMFFHVVTDTDLCNPYTVVVGLVESDVVLNLFHSEQKIDSPGDCGLFDFARTTSQGEMQKGKLLNMIAL